MIKYMVLKTDCTCNARNGDRPIVVVEGYDLSLDEANKLREQILIYCDNTGVENLTVIQYKE